jgi:hypothetical protein
MVQSLVLELQLLPVANVQLARIQQLVLQELVQLVLLELQQLDKVVHRLAIVSAQLVTMLLAQHVLHAALVHTKLL